MGQHKHGKPPTPATAPPAEPRRLELAPPLEIERIPPSIANEVVVQGGIDCIRLEFYYVPQSIYRAAFIDGGSPEFEQSAGINRYRTEPVARVAVPLSLLGEMLTRIIEEATAGTEFLIQDGVGWVQRITEAGQAIASLGQRFQGGLKSAEPVVVNAEESVADGSK